MILICVQTHGWRDPRRQYPPRHPPLFRPQPGKQLNLLLDQVAIFHSRKVAIFKESFK